ncbi:MAG: hypothetical protein A2015_11560 [Spirochaetes bacterium GWF1_31_7]|nr:MAG: hypothetical protein A2Y30_15515 [Spirochaetes bacterium GWE1_32_154]OHD49059.1 MAG: hypothetical protein A2015_11560 [Spirochaetes bacterium GWF1_31_7]OHD50357.1 MAG: hypothetical protein A2Y29_13565 [Spirochaetes bacterium GWE2_31_10]
MKYILSMCIITFFLSCHLEREKEIIEPVQFDEATVIECIDGDTIVVQLCNRKIEKVRFIGVDAPELKTQTISELYAIEAFNYTKAMLENLTVYLEKDVSDRDKYGRLLRYVWLKKPAEVNEQEMRTKSFNSYLILNGYAKTLMIYPDYKYKSFLIKFENEATKTGTGVWSHGK